VSFGGLPFQKFQKVRKKRHNHKPGSMWHSSIDNGDKFVQECCSQTRTQYMQGMPLIIKSFDRRKLIVLDMNYLMNT
jgi:hypothetical protein